MSEILLAQPLPDRDGDGRIALSDATAARLGLTRGTVLLPDGRDGASYRYRIKGAALPAAIVRPAPPVITAPAASTAVHRAPRFVAASGTFGAASARGLSAVYKVKPGVAIDGLTVADHGLDGCGILLRAYGGALSRVVVERIDHRAGRYVAGVGRGLFMATGPVNDVTVRSCRYRSDDPITMAGDVYPAIALAGKTAADVGSGFTFEDLDLEGFLTAYTGADAAAFPNCDGISIEKGYTDGVVRRARIARTADAGIDLKGERWRVEDYTAVDCHKSLKVWASGQDGAIESRNPRGCHVQLAWGGERVIEFLRPISANPKVPLVQFENRPGTVRILAWDPGGLDLAGQVMAKNNGAPRGSCKLILPDREIVV